MTSIKCTFRRSRRVQLLQSALPLFCSRGLRATTSRELAQAAGVSEPVLYANFRDKRELFRCATVLASVARRVVLERSWAGERSLEDVLRVVREVYEDDAEGVRLGFWGLLEDREWTVRVFRREEAAVATRLKSAGAANASQLARLCVAAAIYSELARPQ